MTLLGNCVWEQRLNSLYICQDLATLVADGWFWSLFAELQELNMEEFDRYELSIHIAEHLPQTSMFISKELKRVHIPLYDPENSHIAAFEDEM